MFETAISLFCPHHGYCTMNCNIRTLITQYSSALAGIINVCSVRSGSLAVTSIISIAFGIVILYGVPKAY